MHVGQEVERFLRETDMPPTKFGRAAVNDPRFVGDLRNGREPRAQMRTRVLSFIERARVERADGQPRQTGHAAPACIRDRRYGA